jgi:hypothetical protein
MYGICMKILIEEFLKILRIFEFLFNRNKYYIKDYKIYLLN